MNIKSLAEEERPREKLLLRGKQSLSDAELLAIILGSGSKSESSITLAQRILSSVNHNWNELAKLTIRDLCKFNGVGKVKAIEIITSLEIGRRKSLQQALKKEKISSSKDAYNILQPIIGDLMIEEFWVIYLSRSNKILSKEKISQGGITGTMVDNRLIFKHAIELNAVSLIISHNHPSGNIQPSNSDIQITHEIKKAGNLLNITLMDHLIVTQTSFFSFADENLL
ncbi:JAB domain-containing protein [Apibacter sp. B3706]|uniref:RadC family protein n=1 Tax=Apibacter TaxID=1778601 RepID=UPI00135EFFAC|nr:MULTISPECIES: DNA repair protein RadC [Apibacter]MXP05675.1 DNA repair protein RadC [Apibacter sp. B3546]MXP13050.1 DNA repair protein RadC [Apibacter sp. B3239]QII70572.1 JAB domain-containing protein [Apibacter sp. B3706]QYN48427.1 JAB domain-containing protein [Apibacter sp. ESL0432]